VRELAGVLRAGVRLNPDGVAVREPGRSITYAELDRRADALAHELLRAGVKAGDRVAVWLPKSIDAVASMQAALRAGAVYVPIDPLSPPARARTIIADAAVAVCMTREVVDVPALDPSDAPDAPAGPLPAVERGPDDLAYILYTSGSTGTPKGVCISHRNALAFVEWAHAEVCPSSADRFAGHAPFHFDLSVFDMYVSFWSGAQLTLIPESLSFVGRQLTELARSEAITVWYSVPSALMLMIDQGGLLEAPPRALRAVLFAGEPFPIAYLRRLREALPDVRLLNLYGPTETNVCTFHEVTDIAPDQVHPVPIGKACSGDSVWAERADGRRCAVGEHGELVVAGPTVMKGYWGKAPHEGPYRTGDVVEALPDGAYRYVGRRDSMVKVRGHRVELGEVEVALQAHPDVKEAVVTVAGDGNAARLKAFVSFAGGRRPTLLELKRHCAERLPRYMIVHEVEALDRLPRTGNGKVDRRELALR
jgi:amino acid adenylation domain-containing protein